MSKDPKTNPPEAMWFCFAIRRVPGTYLEPKGWVLRCGEVPEGRLPTLDQSHEPNLFGVVMAKIESISVWFRDTSK